jgi:protein-disulfide isomerase
VGGLVIAGAAVALYEAVGKKDAGRPAPSAVAEQASPDISAAPRADGHVDKIELTAEDFVLGSPNATVTLVEYASLTCPHCAALNNDVMPQIKKDYVETGKMRYVYRDFPLDQLALNASLLARCAGRDRYFGFIDVLFSSQMNWARSTDPIKALEQVARLGGLPPDKFAACLKDEETMNKVLQQRLDAERTFAINATPTLFVDGDRFNGGLSYDQLKAVIESHLAKKG